MYFVASFALSKYSLIKTVSNVLSSVISVYKAFKKDADDQNSYFLSPVAKICLRRKEKMERREGREEGMEEGSKEERKESESGE